MKKSVKEIKLNVSDSIVLKYGTMNRENPKVIYINGKTWLMPLYEGDYENVVNQAISIYKKELKKRLLETDKFERNMLCEFDIRPEAMKVNKKKFLSFDIFIKQKNCLEMKKLKDELSECVGNASDIFADSLTQNDFLLSKVK